MREKSNFIFLALLILACFKSRGQSIEKGNSINIKSSKITKKVTDKDLIDWYTKDINSDTIPGISLRKLYKELQNIDFKKTVTVAIIDSEIAINDSIFTNKLWINPTEVPNDNIDNDKNGYIDDINGWNFLGNNKGENIINANYEYVRVVKALDKKFRDKSILQIKAKDTPKFNYYNKAKDLLSNKLKIAEKKFEYSDKIFKKYIAARDALKEYFPDSKYDIETLKTIDTIGNNLGVHVKEIHEVIAYKETDEMINRVHQNFQDIVTERMNIEFNERIIIGDNPENITDIDYGNNKLSENTHIFTHGTRVASTILANTTSENIRIMPVCISPYGDENDKDIAVAIRYAVDNGAKVINMSFGKEFSLNPEWVFDAFKYADKHNVLIVSSAGNSGFDLSKNNNYYPNDNIDNGREVCNNFILVGSSTPYANEKLLASYSNYGKHDVDLFAPGHDMKTYYPGNKLKDDRGTSLSAAVVSKIASLIYSYYPNLKASDIKDILLKSSVKYKFNVDLKKENDSIKSVSFSELSKSGGVVNAYNALLMAKMYQERNR